VSVLPRPRKLVGSTVRSSEQVNKPKRRLKVTKRVAHMEGVIGCTVQAIGPMLLNNLAV